jgi:hypothetical protein
MTLKQRTVDGEEYAIVTTYPNRSGAARKADAIKKVLRGTKDIPESKVKFWKKKGSLPKTLAGRAMLPSGWTP